MIKTICVLNQMKEFVLLNVEIHSGRIQTQLEVLDPFAKLVIRSASIVTSQEISAQNAKQPRMELNSI